MKILILGAGKMGSFFCDMLSFEHEVAVYDTDPQRLRFTFNCQRFSDLEKYATSSRNSSSTPLPSNTPSTPSVK